MAKIDALLKASCQQKPADQYAVIVVGLLTGAEAARFSLSPIEGLDAIYTGLVSGKAILLLEKLKSIESIALDSSASIL